MDYAGVDAAVSANIRKAIADTTGSVHKTALAAGIPYTTLDRKLRRGSFTLSELHALADLFGRPVSDFLRREDVA